MSDKSVTTHKKFYRVIQPNGQSTGWLEPSWRDAEDHMIAESLMGGMSSRRQSLTAAYHAGYKIEAAS